MMTGNSEKWLSIVEYARTYAISDMTVRRRIKTGKLDAVLKDGKYFIPVSPELKPRQLHMNQNLNSSEIRSQSSHKLTSDQNRHLERTNSQPTENRMGASRIQELTLKPLISRIDELSNLISDTLAEMKDYKNDLKSNYEAKLETLHEKINLKNTQITQFKQEIEDLDVLVKMLEGSEEQRR